MKIIDLIKALRCDAEQLDGTCYGKPCRDCIHNGEGDLLITQDLERRAAGVLERLLAMQQRTQSMTSPPEAGADGSRG